MGWLNKFLEGGTVSLIEMVAKKLIEGLSQLDPKALEILAEILDLASKGNLLAKLILAMVSEYLQTLSAKNGTKLRKIVEMRKGKKTKKCESGSALSKAPKAKCGCTLKRFGGTVISVDSCTGLPINIANKFRPGGKVIYAENGVPKGLQQAFGGKDTVTVKDGTLFGDANFFEDKSGMNYMYYRDPATGKIWKARRDLFNWGNDTDYSLSNFLEVDEGSLSDEARSYYDRYAQLKPKGTKQATATQPAVATRQPAATTTSTTPAAAAAKSGSSTTPAAAAAKSGSSTTPAAAAAKSGSSTTPAAAAAKSGSRPAASVAGTAGSEAPAGSAGSEAPASSKVADHSSVVPETPSLYEFHNGLWQQKSDNGININWKRSITPELYIRDRQAEERARYRENRDIARQIRRSAIRTGSGYRNWREAWRNYRETMRRLREARNKGYDAIDARGKALHQSYAGYLAGQYQNDSLNTNNSAVVVPGVTPGSANTNGGLDFYRHGGVIDYSKFFKN